MEKNARRKFIKNTLTATAAYAVGTTLMGINSVEAKNLEVKSKAFALKFSQVKLPYSYAALEPNIDALTMEIHYTKHHATYIKNVNEAITEEKISFGTEKEFFANASKISMKARNNGGGAFNHNFFWESMTPGNKTKLSGDLAKAISASFGSLEKFKEEFAKAATSRFGSGWAWLIYDGGKLKITSTPNQDNPLMDVAEVKGTPLLALDVWEHAYYLKYQNKRADYITNWWNTVNWDKVAERMTKKM